MSGLLPAGRPGLALALAEGFLKAAGVTTTPALLGRRGYFRDTMGVVGRNDLGLYDDAIFLVTPGAYTAFNANVDPSRDAPGMATLAAGVWRYQLGIHNASKDPAVHPHYLALIQAAPVTVLRSGGAPETGFFGINIHHGSYTTTSSEGCQTIHPDQWQQFITLVEAAMSYYGQKEIKYVLTERGPGDAV